MAVHLVMSLPIWCAASARDGAVRPKGLVSRGTAKEMACGAEPFMCGSCVTRVLHMLRFVAFNIFSVLVIYQWIDGTLAGSKRGHGVEFTPPFVVALPMRGLSPETSNCRRGRARAWKEAFRLFL